MSDTSFNSGSLNVGLHTETEQLAYLRMAGETPALRASFYIAAKGFFGLTMEQAKALHRLYNGDDMRREVSAALAKLNG